mmetsp:Transcript_15695/g.31910  ORF Transcript_15695/g.31910 Transcript_15695/m.31910 type:complete len:131 (-) Transcript_15695:502-894(-)
MGIFLWEVLQDKVECTAILRIRNTGAGERLNNLRNITNNMDTVLNRHLKLTPSTHQIVQETKKLDSCRRTTRTNFNTTKHLEDIALNPCHKCNNNTLGSLHLPVLDHENRFPSNVVNNYLLGSIKEESHL